MKQFSNTEFSTIALALLIILNPLKLIFGNVTISAFCDCAEFSNTYPSQPCSYSYSGFSLNVKRIRMEEVCVVIYKRCLAHTFIKY